MTLDDLERQNRGFYGFLATFACESLYHSQGGATPLTPHAPMAEVYFRSRWAESKWYAIFETITTELEML